MKKLLFASALALGLAGPFVAAHALAAANAPTAAELQQMQSAQSDLLEQHIVQMKAGLKLTDDQAKLWPAFEGAIRAAAKARWDRTEDARQRVSGGVKLSPIDRMSIMADHLDKSSQDLRHVVDAGKPLYDSLDDTQKAAFGPLLHAFRPKRPN